MCLWGWIFERGGDEMGAFFLKRGWNGMGSCAWAGCGRSCREYETEQCYSTAAEHQITSRVCYPSRLEGDVTAVF